jgi:hypothetical protein
MADTGEVTEQSLTGASRASDDKVSDDWDEEMSDNWARFGKSALAADCDAAAGRDASVTAIFSVKP